MTRRIPSSAPDIPGYDYAKLLGSGGFSDVFLYGQRLPKRNVAVKVLLTEQLNSQTKTRFVAEANVMAQLSAHPYIVTIYHADVAADDRPYFVMEYCSGPSLAERYKREVFSTEDALRTGVRLSSAIATAHAAGILHRDIKPANVLTNDFGWPALTDFGISSTVDNEMPTFTTSVDAIKRVAEEAAESTGNQSVGLSVPWSPPEMFGDDPQPDVRSDVFSLAATIYTLLSGRTPFEVAGRSNGTLDLIGRIERGVVTPMDRGDVPRSLIAVLVKGMASKPSDRFASAVEFARALQRVELELGYSPTNIEVPSLGVARVHRDAEESGEDETRVRSVSTIVAQPETSRVTPPSWPQPSVGDAKSEVSAESTQLRSAAGVGEHLDHTVMRPAAAGRSDATEVGTEPDSASAAEEEPVELAPKRRALIVGIIIACVVLVGGGVTAALLVPRQSPSPIHSKITNDAPDPNDGKIVISAVPNPVKGSVTRSKDGTHVNFTWKNPKPKNGDTYQWQQEGTTKPPVPTSKTTATVDGLKAGNDVCIQIWVIRDGRSSPVPLKECTA